MTGFFDRYRKERHTWCAALSCMIGILEKIEIAYLQEGGLYQSLIVVTVKPLAGGDAQFSRIQVLSLLDLPSKEYCCQIFSAASSASPVARTALPGALAASPMTSTWPATFSAVSFRVVLEREPIASTMLS